MSLPTRERGLKSALYNDIARLQAVAPYTGAWIEISQEEYKLNRLWVAPYTGAWIEICGRV